MSLPTKKHAQKSQSWDEEFNKLLNSTPHHYRVQLPQNMASLEPEKLLNSIILAKELAQKWKWDLWLKFRLIFFGIWLHFLLGVAILFLGFLKIFFGIAMIVFTLLSVILGILLLGSIIAFFGGFMGSGEMIVVGLVGTVVTGILLAVSGLGAELSNSILDWNSKSWDKISKLRKNGVDTLIYQREFKLFGFILLENATFFSIFHYGIATIILERDWPWIFGIFSVFWLIGKIGINVPKIEDQMNR